MTRIFSALLYCGFLLFFPSFSFAQGTSEALRLDTAIGLNAYQGLVEEHLAGVLNGLKTLAATEEAGSGSWDRIERPLKEFANDAPTQASVWFAKPDGAYFVVGKGLTSETLKDRSYFPALMGGKEVDGTLVISKSTGERSIIVAAPILRGGRVIGAFGVSLSAVKVANRVADKMGAQKNVIFYALDSSGQTALHYESSLIFAFPSDIGDDSLKSAVKTMLSEPKGVVSYTFGGQQRTAIFQKSKSTGWIFVVGIVHAS